MSKIFFALALYIRVFLLLSRMLLGESEQPNINPIKMVERLFIKLEQTLRGVFG